MSWWHLSISAYWPNFDQTFGALNLFSTQLFEPKNFLDHKTVKWNWSVLLLISPKNFTIIGFCKCNIGALGKYCWQVNRKCSKCNDDKSDDSVINLRFSSGPSLGDGGVHLLGPKNFLQTKYFWDKISSIKKIFFMRGW